MKFMNKTKVAFTLLEMIMVVAMIAVIAGFSIPNFTKSVQKAREKDAAIQLASVDAANRLYFSRNGTFLNSSSTSRDIDFINSGLGISLISNGLTYSYISNGTTYQVNAAWDGPGTANDFTVRYYGFQFGVSRPENPCCAAGSCPSLGAC